MSGYSFSMSSGRDGHETLTSRDRDLGFTSRDRDETLKFRDETDTWRLSRDVIETWNNCGNITMKRVFQCLKLSNEYLKLLDKHNCGPRDNAYKIRRFVYSHFVLQLVSRSCSLVIGLVIAFHRFVALFCIFLSIRLSSESNRLHPVQQ